MIARIPMEWIRDVASRLMAGALLTTVAAAGLLAGCGSTLNPQVRSSIQAEVKSQQPNFATCYSEALEQDADLQGTMSLTFLVDHKTGELTDVAITGNQLKNQRLEQCVVKQAEDIIIEPSPSRPVRVTYPISFSSPSG